MCFLELGCRRLRLHMTDWFERTEAPHDRRVSGLAVSMLGDRMGCTSEIPHPGGNMHFKAAETGVLLEWALALWTNTSTKSLWALI